MPIRSPMPDSGGQGALRASTGPQLDSHTPALVERAQINSRRSLLDLDAWIISQVRPAGARSILDLGCGTGKQLFALARAADPTASIVGFDISEEAVAAVNARALKEGHTNVRAVQGDLDACPDALDFGPFDLILSTYSMYYATNMPALLRDLRKVLFPDGRLFVCGPGHGTNKELVDLVNRLASGAPERISPVEDFIDEATVGDLRTHYSGVSMSRLKNAVRFASVEEVLGWWRNHNFHRPSLELRLVKALEDHFRLKTYFEMTKNVLAVHCDA